MNNQINEILYHYNEEGYEGYDLSEVQLLRNKDIDRIEKLKSLLDNDNQYIAYQAMLILLAWAIPEGFQQLDRFISEKWDEKESFESHRIHSEDNVYDVITDALYISTMNGKTEEELYPYIKHFLSIYGNKLFESNLKDFLLKKNCRPLLKEIEQAIQDALQSKRYYQASQLFPVLVNYDKNSFNQYVDIFNSLINEDDRISYNIDEAQAIKTKKSI
ncbi:hypothetical protein QX233_21755 [Chryseobacterium gambrini]|uniref:Uncharacterized protein n=2 Tax=Chryseobacterium TaxID=59732 RepID=A0AAJ1VL44_9FLAO|nr:MULTISPECIES: hypothetical protein [Chryseobacterium]MCF2218378.1 hypothetical protein [Chryseobacterium sp. PS-8]MDN4015080.1 hypothetical protein [Chryseobacterium gambrini]MDN4028083.1 hypothetical protein [Chryseobacterium gambrini]QWA39798.1 hypothetical protein KKI44_06210 [Chryseobacterium sp. ZHDP1]